MASNVGFLLLVFCVCASVGIDSLNLKQFRLSPIDLGLVLSDGQGIRRPSDGQGIRRPSDGQGIRRPSGWQFGGEYSGHFQQRPEYVRSVANLSPLQHFDRETQNIVNSVRHEVETKLHTMPKFVLLNYKYDFANGTTYYTKVDTGEGDVSMIILKIAEGVNETSSLEDWQYPKNYDDEIVAF